MEGWGQAGAMLRPADCRGVPQANTSQYAALAWAGAPGPTAASGTLEDEGSAWEGAGENLPPDTADVAATQAPTTSILGTMHARSAPARLPGVGPACHALHGRPAEGCPAWPLSGAQARAEARRICMCRGVPAERAMQAGVARAGTPCVRAS